MNSKTRASRPLRLLLTDLIPPYAAGWQSDAGHARYVFWRNQRGA